MSVKEIRKIIEFKIYKSSNLEVDKVKMDRSLYGWAIKAKKYIHLFSHQNLVYA